MRNTRRQERVFLAMASCAAAVLGSAQAAFPAPSGNGDSTARETAPMPRVASRDLAERYYQAYRLIGSLVLDLDGKRIGRVSSVTLDDRGDIRKVLIALADTGDTDGGSIVISPYRAEVVSTDGALVTVIRVDLSREELIQAQLVRLKSNARAPAQRGAGMPDPHREFGPLY